MSGTLFSFCASLDTLDQLVLVARTTQEEEEEEETTTIIVSLSFKYNYYEQQHTILHVVRQH